MRTLALAALLLATACGKPLLYAEVEIPSATVLVPQQLFPSTASPGLGDYCTPDPAFPPLPNTVCLQRVVEYDLGDDFRDLIAEAEELDLRLTTLGIALAVTDQLTDLGAVARVRIVAEAVADLPAVELASYVRSGTVPPTTIEVAAHASVNLGPYAQAGIIAIRSEMEFDAATVIPEFTADVTGEFYVRVLIDWGKQAGL